MRVLHTLLAARGRFHVTLVTLAAASERDQARRDLQGLCDEVVLLPRQGESGRAAAMWHGLAARVYSLATGLRPSNYAIGKLGLSASRVERLLQDGAYDCALFEYWHATPAVRVLRRRGIPCVLDMHDILWRSYARQLDVRGWLPSPLRRWAVRRYRRREENAWRAFDAVTAINDEEYQYVLRCQLPSPTRVFCAPMGVSLDRWPYGWKPARPSRFAFYGGLAGAQNQDGARRCFERILPAIWRRFPDTELWLIGSEPPDWLRKLAADPRIRVTGFVEDVAPLLASMTGVLCPWTGTYGFRSRLVEVMAVGVPVVASRDAVDGMGISEGQGVLLGDSDAALAGNALRLIEDAALAESLSRAGRERVEALFSIERTYGRWMRELHDWLPTRERLAS